MYKLCFKMASTFYHLSLVYEIQLYSCYLSTVLVKSNMRFWFVKFDDFPNVDFWVINCDTCLLLVSGMMFWLSFDYTLCNAFDILKLAIREPCILCLVENWWKYDISLIEIQFGSQGKTACIHCTLHSFNSTASLSIIIIIIYLFIYLFIYFLLTLKQLQCQ